ncbi:MAG: hypothetical protein AABY22_30085, partial [Nanoarchaeota archaeon]
GKYIDIGHIELKKIKNEYDKLETIKRFLISKQTLFEKCEHYVEAPLLAFKAKSSMAVTIGKLQRINGQIFLFIYLLFNKKSVPVYVSTARKLCGIVLPKKSKRKDTKKLILNFVQNLGIVPKEKWTYKRTGNPSDFCFDQADAYVVAASQIISKNNI